jgi:hypothetical protein
MRESEEGRLTVLRVAQWNSGVIEITPGTVKLLK